MQDRSLGATTTASPAHVPGRIVPPYPDDHLARALAWGFLAAPEWSEPALVSAGQVTLGRRHRWLPRVVRPVLSAYRSAPLDRPSELTGFLLGGTSLPRWPPGPGISGGRYGCIL